MAARRRRPADRSISGSELEVLGQLWEGGPRTPTELQRDLADRGLHWAYTTVQTFLHRLHDKAFVQRERKGRGWVYRAKRSRAEVLSGQVDRMASKVFGGRPSLLVQSFIQSGRLTRPEIVRLRKLLDDAEDELGARRRGRGRS